MKSAGHIISQKYTPLLDCIQRELKNMNDEFDSILENLDHEEKPASGNEIKQADAYGSNS